MQSENVEEYKLVRGEMLTVKDCITKYVSFALGGSAAAIYGMARIVAYKPGNYELAIISPALSLMISFVLLILFYKFYSHNRFAGYCKLLTLEQHPNPGSLKGNVLFLWEVAVDRDRYSGIEKEKEAFKSILDKVNTQNIDKGKLKDLLDKYLGTNPDIDKDKFKRGMRILYSATFGKIEARSWAYPPLIVSMFFFISSGFLLVGWAQMIIDTINKRGSLPFGHVIGSLIVLISITIAQICLWKRFIGRLHSLMNGSEKINAFFCKFIPIRALFLNTFGIVPEYIDADDLFSSSF
jgi:hypothetical protein